MLRHASSDIHKQTAAGRKGRLPGQPTLLAVTVAADHNSNQGEGARQEGAGQEGARQEGAGHEGARQDEGRREEAGGRLQNAPASLTRPVMTISDQTTNNPGSQGRGFQLLLPVLRQHSEHPPGHGP